MIKEINVEKETKLLREGKFELRDFAKLIPSDFVGRVIDDTSVRYIKGYMNDRYILDRTDGPAYYSKGINGMFGRIYFLNGDRYPKEKWFNQLTEEQKIAALLNPENY